MKEELKGLLKELSTSDFEKVKLLYKMTNGIKGNSIDEFVNNVPDKTVPGVIKLCNEQMRK